MSTPPRKIPRWLAIAAALLTAAIVGAAIYAVIEKAWLATFGLFALAIFALRSPWVRSLWASASPKEGSAGAGATIDPAAGDFSDPVVDAKQSQQPDGLPHSGQQQPSSDPHLADTEPEQGSP